MQTVYASIPAIGVMTGAGTSVGGGGSGVGLGTVSRVINRHPQVAEALRARVQAAIERLGYAPDVAAQSLRAGRTRSFACVFRDLTVPVLASFVDSMQRELGAEGYGVLFGRVISAVNATRHHLGLGQASRA